jgi:H+/Cl- antiporter ClcA
MIETVLSAAFWSVVVAASVVGVFVFDYTQHLIDNWLNFKPFNCVYCVTFWVSAIAFPFLGVNIFVAFFSAFISNEMFKLFLKWLTNTKVSTLSQIAIPVIATRRLVYVLKQVKMPIPSPKNQEKQSDFISRCVSTPVMVKDFPNEQQRLAVCYLQWKNK